MSAKYFVDTNILIYAHDLDAGDKHHRANALIREFWEAGGAMISIQVLQEFYVNATKKIARPISAAQARGIVEAYRAWQVENNTVDTVLRASEIQERYQLSFWDALIIAAAVQGRADILLSEDLNAGQVIEGVAIQNPLMER